MALEESMAYDCETKAVSPRWISLLFRISPKTPMTYFLSLTSLDVLASSPRCLMSDIASKLLFERCSLIKDDLRKRFFVLGYKILAFSALVIAAFMFSAL